MTGPFGSLEVNHIHLSIHAIVCFAHPIEDKGSKKREQYIFPVYTDTSSGASASQVSNATSTTLATSPEDLSTPTPPSQVSTFRSAVSQNSAPASAQNSAPAVSQRSKPRPAPRRKPQKSSSQPQTSTESVSQTAPPRPSLLPINPISQVAGVSDSPPTGSLPPVGTLGVDDDVALFVTALGVRHILSQVQTAPRDSQAPTERTPEIPADPSQLIDRPSQVAVGPSQLTVNPSQSVGEPPSQPTIKPAQVVPMDAQPSSTTIPIPHEPHAGTVDSPKVPYRVRNPDSAVVGMQLRRDSIEGAPGMNLDIHLTSRVMQDAIDSGSPEVTVDLGDYLNMDSSDDETHVSSSQKSVDGCRDLLLPTPDPRRQQSGTKGAAGVVAQPLPAPSRSPPQLDVDEDLPGWMVGRGQWKFIVSATGGPAWDSLLKIYMKQERRLEFSEVVRYLACIFPSSGAERPTGSGPHV